MSQDAVFSVTEVLAPGQVVGNQAGGTRFEWTAINRNAPAQPWTSGDDLRTKRTDYPGGDGDLIEQVLGPKDRDQTFQGTWDDRYNTAGYALAERAAFRAMVRRGNLVTIAFGSFAYLGLITSAEYQYKNDQQIGYQFTVSVHRDQALDGDARKARFTPIREPDMVGVLARANLELTAMAADAPLQALNFPSAVVLDPLGDLSASIAELDATINQPIADVEGQLRSSLLKVRQLVEQVKAVAARALGGLIDLRSDLDLGVQTATAVITFDEWAHGMSVMLRAMIFQSESASRELADRSGPNDDDYIYRPYSGEHLYHISLRFNGTANDWRDIAERNGLTAQVCTGDEVLLIPRRR